MNFSIAINDSYKPKDGEWVELITYVDCVCWINPKVGQNLKKGLLVQINGRMGSRAWVNNDGDAKSSLTCSIAGNICAPPGTGIFEGFKNLGWRLLCQNDSTKTLIVHFDLI